MIEEKRQKKLEANRKWQKQNREKCVASALKWRAENREKFKEYRRTAYRKKRMLIAQEAREGNEPLSAVALKHGISVRVLNNILKTSATSQ